MADVVHFQRSMTTTSVFDLGGVLIDWNPRHLYRKLSSDDVAIDEFLREVDFPGWNTAMDRGMPLADGVRQLKRQFPHRAAWIDAWMDRWRESISGPIAGTVAILEELRAAGVPLLALSNWAADTFAAVRGDFPFLAHFEHIVLSGAEGVVKPDPEIFRRLLARSGRRAEECLFIDDVAANVAAAQSVGFAAIQFRTPEDLRQELVRRGILRDS
jgi:2-haloacid dehalogenase